MQRARGVPLTRLRKRLFTCVVICLKGWGTRLSPFIMASVSGSTSTH